MGFDPTISRSEVKRASHYTVLDLIKTRQKDNIHVESASRDFGGSVSKIHLELV